MTHEALARRLVFFHKLPTPYNDFLFRALGAYPRVSIRVLHLWKKSDNRPWTAELGMGYSNTYLSLKLGIDWAALKAAFQERDSYWLIADWGHLAAIVLLIARIFRGNGVGIWADTPQEQLRRPPIKRFLRRVFLRWLLRRVDHVFATGEIGMRTVVSMGARPGRVRNLPCYVDLSEPNRWKEVEGYGKRRESLRSRVGCDEESCVFVAVSQLTVKKGVDVAITAFAALRPELRAKAGLLVAGDGPELASHVGLARDLGCADRVAFLGWLNPDQVADVYGSADALIHVARWDPFPLAVLEAMSWGRPVIGTSCCGTVVDRVRDGRSGFVVDVDDPEETSAKMAIVISDAALRAQMGEAARRAAEEWPVERGVMEIVRAIDEVKQPLTLAGPSSTAKKSSIGTRRFEWSRKKGQ